MIRPEDLQIERIIIHRVHKKDEGRDYGIAEHSNELFDFGVAETETLKKRISTAFSKQKRFFKLEIAQCQANSFFDYAINIKNSDNQTFIDKSQKIADLLAISHDKKTIPSGLLLIMDGYIRTKHFVIVIKAELQEAFTIKEMNERKVVELIHDLFLSPAKDFYKIGYLVEDRNNATFPNDNYSAFMYDDNFSSGNRDLAEYFYHRFLGFETNRNDKLLSRNFFHDIHRFIDNNVFGFENIKGLKNALNSLYRENTTGIINPDEFIQLNFNEELINRYNNRIGIDYPHSFTKDLTLLDRRLQRGVILLAEDLKIEGPSEAIDNVSVINGDDVDIEALSLAIENGDIKQLITIKTEN